MLAGSDRESHCVLKKILVSGAAEKGRRIDLFEPHQSLFRQRKPLMWNSKKKKKKRSRASPIAVRIITTKHVGLISLQIQCHSSLPQQLLPYHHHQGKREIAYPEMVNIHRSPNDISGTPSSQPWINLVNTTHSGAFIDHDQTIPRMTAPIPIFVLNAPRPDEVSNLEYPSVRKPGKWRCLDSLTVSPGCGCRHSRRRGFRYTRWSPRRLSWACQCHCPLSAPFV